MMIKFNICKIGFYVGLMIDIGQHCRDELLVKNFINLFDCEYYNINSKKNYIRFRISNFDTIYNKTLPIFSHYKFKGIKELKFKDFCLVTEMIKKKEHLTIKGLEKIKIIKSQMNKARYLKPLKRL